MIILTDTFNDRTISRHRTVGAAVRAQRKHLRAVKRRNGENSYLAYSITCSKGTDISDEVMQAKMDLDQRY